MSLALYTLLFLKQSSIIFVIYFVFVASVLVAFVFLREAPLYAWALHFSETLSFWQIG